jgi:uncharacterized protein (DUF58 family)
VKESFASGQNIQAGGVDVAAWRFLTWILVLFALLLETRAAYGLAAVAVILFYILPNLQRRAVENLMVEYPRDVVRLFSGEEAVLSLTVRNASWLPLPWVSGVEYIPLGLGGRTHRWVVSLSPKEEAHLECRLIGRNRGVYEVGPIRVLGGDLFGISTAAMERELYHTVVVYPERLPFSALSLPSRLFPGNIRAQQRIYPDPSRLGGVRPYKPGDPLKTVHWKATGRTGALQVKQYEHTITLNVMILLNMDEPDYDVHSWYSDKELAVQAAAAVAHHAAQSGEACGFATYARYQKWRAGDSGQPDTFSGETGALVIPPSQGQLMDIMTALAGVECQPEPRFLGLVDQVGRGLSWGAVLVLVVPRDTPELVEQAYRLARLGLSVVFLVVGGPVEHQALLGRESRGVSVHRVVREEQRLELWPQAQVRGGSA